MTEGGGRRALIIEPRCNLRSLAGYVIAEASNMGIALGMTGPTGANGMNTEFTGNFLLWSTGGNIALDSSIRTTDGKSLTFISGGIDMGNHTISNVQDPANPQDVATKNYIDSKPAITSTDIKYTRMMTGGSAYFTGSVTIDQNLDVKGDIIQRQELVVVDPLFEVAASGAPYDGDNRTFGFFAKVQNQTLNSGIIRDNITKDWYILNDATTLSSAGNVGTVHVDVSSTNVNIQNLTGTNVNIVEEKVTDLSATTFTGTSVFSINQRVTNLTGTNLNIDQARFQGQTVVALTGDTFYFTGGNVTELRSTNSYSNYMTGVSLFSTNSYSDKCTVTTGSFTYLFSNIISGATINGDNITGGNIYSNYIECKENKLDDIRTDHLTGTSVHITDLVVNNISGSSQFITCKSIDSDLTNMSGTNIVGAYLTVYDTTGTNIKSINNNTSNLKVDNLTGTNCHFTEVSATDIKVDVITGTNVFASTLSGASLNAPIITGTTLTTRDIRSTYSSSTTVSGANGFFDTMLNVQSEITNFKSTNISGTNVLDENIRVYNLRATVLTGSQIYTTGGTFFSVNCTNMSIENFTGLNSSGNDIVFSNGMYTWLTGTNFHSTNGTITNLSSTTFGTTQGNVTYISSTTITGTDNFLASVRSTNTTVTYLTGTNINNNFITGNNGYFNFISGTELSESKAFVNDITGTSCHYRDVWSSVITGIDIYAQNLHAVSWVLPSDITIGNLRATDTISGAVGHFPSLECGDFQGIYVSGTSIFGDGAIITKLTGTSIYGTHLNEDYATINTLTGNTVFLTGGFIGDLKTNNMLAQSLTGSNIFITGANIDTAKIYSLTGTNINFTGGYIHNLNSNNAQIQTLTGSNIFITGANIDTAKIYSLTGTILNFTGANIVDLSVSNNTVLQNSSVSSVKVYTDYNSLPVIFYAPLNMSKDATFSQAGASLVGTLNGGATISNGYLNSPRVNSYVSYDTTNLTISTTCTIRFIYVPSYGGTPSSTCYLLYIDGVSAIRLLHWNDGNLNIIIKNSVGADIVNSFTAWSPVANKEYEFEIDMDTVGGTTRIFINGVQFGPTLSGTGTRTSSYTKFYLGGQGAITDSVSRKFRSLIVYNTVQHTSNYTPDYGYSANFLPMTGTINNLVIYDYAKVVNAQIQTLTGTNLNFTGGSIFGLTTNNAQIQTLTGTNLFITGANIDTAKIYSLTGTDLYFTGATLYNVRATNIDITGSSITHLFNTYTLPTTGGTFALLSDLFVGGGATYYLNKSQASDIGGYFQMIETPSLAVESTLVTAVTNASDVIISSFATPVGNPNLSLLNSGEFDVEIYASVNAGSTCTIYAQLYLRTGVTETLLGTSGLSDILTTTPIEEHLSVLFPTTAFNTSTDRLVLKIIGKNTSVTSRNITTYYEGTTRTAHAHTTLPSVPSSLSNLNITDSITGVHMYATSSFNASNGAITTLTGTNLSYTGAFIDTAKIYSLTGTNLNFTGGSIFGLNSNNARIQTLTGSNIFITGANIDTAKIYSLTGTNLNFTGGYIYGLNSNNAQIETLTGTNIYASNLVYVSSDQSIGGIKTFSDTTEATSSTAGGTIVSGGLALAKKLYVGGGYIEALKSDLANGGTAQINLGKETLNSSQIYYNHVADNDNTNFTSIRTIQGGELRCFRSGISQFTNTTDATTSSSASLITSGGLGVAKSAIIGQKISSTSLNTTNSTIQTLTGTNLYYTGGYISVINEEQEYIYPNYKADPVFFFSPLLTSKDASYSQSGGSLVGTLNGGATVANGYLTTSGASSYLSYVPTNNFTFTQTFCIRFIYVPSYSGAPSETQYPIHFADTGSSRIIRFTHNQSSGNIQLNINSNTGAIVNYSVAWLPVAGKEYEFEIDSDLTTGATRMFINGVQLGVTQTGTGTSNNPLNQMYIGGVPSVNSVGSKFRNLLVFNTVQHNADYTPTYELVSFDNSVLSRKKNLTINDTLTATTINTTDILTSNLNSNKVNVYANYDADPVTFYIPLNYNSNATYSQSGGSLVGTPSNSTIIPGYLYTTGTSSYLSVSPTNNLTFSQQGCIRFIYVPGYSGAPSTEQYLFSAIGSGDANSIYILNLSSGGGLLSYAMYNSSAAAVIDTSASWSPVDGKEYEIELDFNLTTGATRMFVNGTQVGTTQTATATRTSALVSCSIGGITGVLSLGNKVRNLVTFNTVQHTANYTPLYELLSSDNNTTGISYKNNLSVYNTLSATTITGANISATTITGANISATTITGANISVTSLTGTSLNITNISAALITGTTIKATNLDITGTSITHLYNTYTLPATGGTLALLSNIGSTQTIFFTYTTTNGSTVSNSGSPIGKPIPGAISRAVNSSYASDGSNYRILVSGSGWYYYDLQVNLTGTTNQSIAIFADTNTFEPRDYYSTTFDPLTSWVANLSMLGVHHFSGFIYLTSYMRICGDAYSSPWTAPSQIITMYRLLTA